MTGPAPHCGCGYGDCSACAGYTWACLDRGAAWPRTPPGTGLCTRCQTATDAGHRCECHGGCGHKHRNGQGRCLAEDTPRNRLHAVAPATGAGPLTALCDPCHAAHASISAAARRAAHDALSLTEPLF